MEKSQLVPAVARAAAILDLVAASEGPVRFPALVAALALPKSSAHGLCQTLCALRLLRDTGEGYVIGPAVLPWAAGFGGEASVLRAFDAVAASAPDLAPFTLTLSTLDGGDVVYLACRNSDAPLGITFRIGMRVPAVYSATGKALLAGLPADELARVLSAPWPAALTTGSVADAASLHRQLASVRRDGYSVDDGEMRAGMVCLGATIPGRDGRPVAGIAISMTAAEATGDAKARLGAHIAALARRIADETT